MQFKEHEICATVSVGIALAPEDGNSSERLLKSADLALYKAKADGRNCVRFFVPEMDATLQARIELERTLRDAVAARRLRACTTSRSSKLPATASSALKR